MSGAQSPAPRGVSRFWRLTRLPEQTPKIRLKPPFIERILQHIDGSIYVSPRTGLFTLKLTRDDYEPTTLLELNRSNVIRLESFERTLPEELINQVTLAYHDRTTDKSVSISVQDIAGIERSLGEIKDAKVSYEGVSNGALAARLAMRDLRQLSSALAKVTLIANRVSASLNIGDVFKFAWPELQIEHERPAYQQLT